MVRKYPAVITLLAVLGGIIIADNFHISGWLYLTGAGFALALGIIGYYRKAGGLSGAGVLAALLLVSAFQYVARVKEHPAGHISHFADEAMVYSISGAIFDWPEVREYGTILTVAVDSLAGNGVNIRSCGRMRLHLARPTTALQIGDKISFAARIAPIRATAVSSRIDRRRYLAGKGIFAEAWLDDIGEVKILRAERNVFLAGIERIRETILAFFKTTLNEKEAALASGFLVGETRDISPEIYGYFRDSGTLHLLAVSGANVALVLWPLAALFRALRLREGHGTILLLMAVGLFALIAHAQPSVIRASLMAALIIIGRDAQRRIEGNNIIACGALIILLFDPTYLFDIGFQMSFITAWGLIYMVPRLMRVVKDRKHYRYIRWAVFPIVIALVAQVVSLPLSAYYFSRLPLPAFFSNLAIVPLVALAVVGEMILLAAGMVLPAMGTVIGAILNPLLSLIIALLNFFAATPGHNFRIVSLPPGLLLLYYIILILAVISLTSRKGRYFLVGAVISFVAWLVWMPNPSRDISPRLTFMAAPGGMAVIANGPPVEIILLDINSPHYSFAERSLIPFMRERGYKKANVTVLSLNRSALKDAVMLAGRGFVDSMSLPREAGNLFYDIWREHNLPEDSFRFMPLEGVMGSDGQFIRQWGGWTFLFRPGHTEANWNWREGGDSAPPAVVKSFLNPGDIAALSSEDRPNLKYLICNRISRLNSNQFSDRLGQKIGGVYVWELSPSGMGELIKTEEDWRIAP